MGNRKGLKWFLILFIDKNKTEIFKIIPCKTIKEMAYYLNLPQNTINNFYHNLIKSRGILDYCNITQNYKL